jgi:hypothetical protein
MRHPAPRGISHSQLFLKDLFDGRNRYQTVPWHYSRTEKRIPSEKCLKFWTQSQEIPIGTGRVVAWEITAFEPPEPDFDLEPPISIVIKYTD